MELGKIGRTEIENLFQQKKGKANKKVIQGPAFGVDTSIIEINEHVSMVVASDPASFIPSLGIKESAWLTVILPANDIATSGELPAYAQFVLNLPHSMSHESLQLFWKYIHEFCSAIGIAITGGHTGFDDIGSSTLAGGSTLFSIIENQKIKSSAFAKPNQDLILTKTAALSSAAILAKSFPKYCQENLGKKVQQNLSDSFYLTSILPEVQILSQHAAAFQAISALHDVTEGGALGAIYELCVASNLGVKVIKDKIFVGEEQAKICTLFNIDPLRSTGAGSLLISCDKDWSASILEILNENQIAAAVVAETRKIDEGRKIIDVGEEKELTYIEKDPYWDAFSKAIELGLK